MPRYYFNLKGGHGSLDKGARSVRTSVPPEQRHFLSLPKNSRQILRARARKTRLRRSRLPGVAAAATEMRNVRASTQIGITMKPAKLLLTCAFLIAGAGIQAMADCQIADAKLE